MTEIRRLPAQQERVETGPVQFGDDWPGAFIRGDNAGWYAMQVGMLLRQDLPLDPMLANELRNLQRDLGSSIVGPCQEMVATSAIDRVQATREAMRHLTPEQRRQVVDEFFVLCGVLQPRADSCLKPIAPPATISAARPEGHDS